MVWFNEIKEIIAYKSLLWNLVTRELTVKYRRSFLGFLWSFLHPLTNTIIFTIVFGAIFNLNIKDYIIYLLVGLQLWNFFAQSTAQSSRSLLHNGGLIKRVYIPKSVFVFSIIISQLINMLLGFIPIMLLILLIGQGLKVSSLIVPVVFIFGFLFTLGLSLILSVICVLFPDIIEAYQLLLTPWMYITPIIYPLNIVPPKYLYLIKINPMYYIIECFRLPLLSGVLPAFNDIWLAGLSAVFALTIGFIIYNKMQNEIVFYL